MATKQSRPQSSGLEDMGRRPGASLPVMGAQYRRTEAAFAVDEWRLRLHACVRTRVDTTSTCCDIISMPICTLCDMKRFMLC